MNLWHLQLSLFWKLKLELNRWRRLGCRHATYPLIPPKKLIISSYVCILKLDSNKTYWNQGDGTSFTLFNVFVDQLHDEFSITTQFYRLQKLYGHSEMFSRKCSWRISYHGWHKFSFITMWKSHKTRCLQKWLISRQLLVMTWKPRKNAKKCHNRWFSEFKCL